MHQKDSFFTPQPCPKVAVFLPTGGHVYAPVHYTGTHICAPVHYTGAHKCAPIQCTGALVSAPVHHTDALTSTPVQPLVRACPPHRRAPRAHLKIPLMCTHARLFCGQVRTYACLPPNRPHMQAHILPKNTSKPLYGPP
jgi:hypothetical protein